MVQDPSNERPLKRPRLTPRDDSDENLIWVRREIAGIKKTLKEMASEAREDREKYIGMFEELDFDGIKESLEEMSYEAREEREHVHNMLAHILLEVEQTD